jgi:hypothetical protein
LFNGKPGAGRRRTGAGLFDWEDFPGLHPFGGGALHLFGETQEFRSQGAALIRRQNLNEGFGGIGQHCQAFGFIVPAG